MPRTDRPLLARANLCEPLEQGVLVSDLGVLDPPAGSHHQMPPFPSVDRASTRARAQRTEVRFCLGQVRLIATVSKVHSQEFLKSTQLPAIFAFPRTNGA